MVRRTSNRDSSSDQSVEPMSSNSPPADTRWSIAVDTSPSILTARSETSDAAPAGSRSTREPMRSEITRAAESPTTRAASRRNAAFRPRDSTMVNSRARNCVAIGMAGEPLPEPRSYQVPRDTVTSNDACKGSVTRRATVASGNAASGRAVRLIVRFQCLSADKYEDSWSIWASVRGVPAWAPACSSLPLRLASSVTEMWF